MILYRLVKEQYKEHLSGFGAYKYGGRWNSIGTSVIYTSQSRALCLAEILVHVDLGIIPADYWLLEIYVPDDSIAHYDSHLLPLNWNEYGTNPKTQRVGDAFVDQNQYLTLQLPSAVVKGDHNYLINPEHPDFKKTKIVSSSPFPLDRRLFSS